MTFNNIVFEIFFSNRPSLKLLANKYYSYRNNFQDMQVKGAFVK